MNLRAEVNDLRRRYQRKVQCRLLDRIIRRADGSVMLRWVEGRELIEVQAQLPMSRG